MGQGQGDDESILNTIPVHSLRAHSGPLGLQVGQHVSEHRFVGLGSLILQLLAGLAGLVVYWLFSGQGLLELAMFVQSVIENNILLKKPLDSLNLHLRTYQSNL